MKSSVRRGWKFQPGVIIIYHNTWCVLFFVWFPTRQKKRLSISITRFRSIENLGASLFSVEVSRGNRENGHTWRSERLSHFDRWLWWLCDRLIMAFLVGWYFFPSVWGNFEMDRMFHSNVAVGINVSDKLTFVFFLVAGNWDFLLSILAHIFAE